MNAAQTGFIFLAVAFPVYLLWRGKLPGYLALMTTDAGPAVDPTKGSGAGAVAPGSSLPGYPGVPMTPLFYSPVNPQSQGA